MAWTTITGSNSIWQYDDAATASDTYPDANGTYSSGIRTFTTPGGTVQKTYVSCRKVGETILRGELSKTYYDAQ
ncbi:MAG: hypothetical protein QGH83_10475 [Candidatus Pacebacteria bacterium]|jgi:hypothetical protein|nr:hypothetical protein [Candidatus Paceibacterota bacterium]|tara:strand:- start:63 stop:284 length:222 start_codon:yes stop_codon:yes gene_type:complete